MTDHTRIVIENAGPPFGSGLEALRETRRVLEAAIELLSAAEHGAEASASTALKSALYIDGNRQVGSLQFSWDPD